MPERAQQPPVGILVVHGIGAQNRGEMLEKVTNGIRRIFPDLPAGLKEGERVHLGDRAVRFYEVYWADLLKGDRVTGTFEMEELSSLAWFPLLNQRSRSYESEPYPLRTVLWWTIILPFTGFALQLVYWGARLLAQIRDVPRRRAEQKRAGEASDDGDKSLWQRAQDAAHKTSQGPTAVDRLLDEYVGDVFNYINSAGDMFSEQGNVPEDLRGVYRDILDRFYDQLARAHGDGCQSIQIIAHSLGTVVTYHALRGLRFGESPRDDRETIVEASGRVEHLYTIGSPLEKIRFFWPRLRPENNLAGERDIAWDNFVSYFDPVAGVLRRYTEWGGVDNHHLLGGGFLTGHVVYERSPVFLQSFSRGLLGQPRTLHRTTGEKFKDWALLLGETLLAPAGLAVLVGAGLALWVVTALLVPYLISIPFRFLFAPETWGPFLDYGGAFFAACFLVVFSIVPWIRAKETFKRLWNNGSKAED